MSRAGATAAIGLWVCLLMPAPAKAGDSKVPAFVLKVRDDVYPYEPIGAFVLPGEALSLETSGDRVRDRYSIEASGGIVEQIRPHRWRWHAPAGKGLYRIEVRNPETRVRKKLNVFVMVPFDALRGEYLNGYRMGRYPSKRLNNRAAYDLPRGFVEVTKENDDTAVSAHFKLKEFLSKQPSGYPKYLVLQEKLIADLEAIYQVLNEKGIPCERLQIMSGYRTPFYNKAIGNTTTFSRHNWGDGADIFVDNDHNDRMDDLNGDGKSDKKDALFLQGIIQSMIREPEYRHLAGGISAYDSTSAHGPFVHVDTRGYEATW